MGTGRVRGAGRCWVGAALVVLAVLGARGAHGKETTGYFLEMVKAECQYVNGTERVRFLVRYIHNRQPLLHFDSNVGFYMADSPLGEPEAKYWNSQPDIIEREQGEVDRLCRHNYGVFSPFTVERRGECTGEPWVWQGWDTPTPSTLPAAQGGAQGASLEDGDEPGHWDRGRGASVHSCAHSRGLGKVPAPCQEDTSPLCPPWTHPMLTGVGGLVLGLIFLALGLVLYLRNKKGRAVAQPAGLLN
ncbi:DLA class II histocompatibility antigen, DR-1 beta chain-like [Apteryx rowi]|uniref:DLA class II histocompatibility antigen, DR-1 beta chain-like n=1 Tax=Apteryx rowi TaxID=308060 RepID=UPI000E1C9886|nr:DLA class II histocompatibility antigen, DR-1 beta chain-like [Apteryx rowi]